MLPIIRRIKKESFEKIMKEGVFLPAKNFYMRFLDRKDDQISQFSFIVPSKVEKTSVGRHLIKRKMTNIIEQVLPSVKPGFSCLLYAKSSAPLLSYEEIKKEILNLLEKEGVLNAK